MNICKSSQPSVTINCSCKVLFFIFLLSYTQNEDGLPEHVAVFIPLKYKLRYLDIIDGFIVNVTISTKEQTPSSFTAAICCHYLTKVLILFPQK